MIRGIAAAFALAAMLGAGLAAEAAGIRVEEAWARATPGAAKVGAAYFTVDNHGATADRLLGASVAPSVAERSEIHTHLMEGGVMRMRPVQAVEVEPGAELVFQPGGLHIMLIGLKKPLRQGDVFALTLVFEKAGPVTVDVGVRAVGAPGRGGHGPAHSH